MLPRVIVAGGTMLPGLTPRPGLFNHAHAPEFKIGGAESNADIARGGITAAMMHG